MMNARLLITDEKKFSQGAEENFPPPRTKRKQQHEPQDTKKHLIYQNNIKRNDCCYFCHPFMRQEGTKIIKDLPLKSRKEIEKEKLLTSGEVLREVAKISNNNKKMLLLERKFDRRKKMFLLNNVDNNYYSMKKQVEKRILEVDDEEEENFIKRSNNIVSCRSRNSISYINSSSIRLHDQQQSEDKMLLSKTKIRTKASYKKQEGNRFLLLSLLLSSIVLISLRGKFFFSSYIELDFIKHSIFIIVYAEIWKTIIVFFNKKFNYYFILLIELESTCRLFFVSSNRYKRR